MTGRLLSLALAAALLAPAPAAASDISTHVLDLAKGVGGAGVPVTLARRTPAGWEKVATATTDGNGRVRSFGDAKTGPGVYRLTFDMTGYAPNPDPFFPEIALTFRVTDPAGHYHVPVVVSPFGFSSYRGN